MKFLKTIPSLKFQLYFVEKLSLNILHKHIYLGGTILTPLSGPISTRTKTKETCVDIQGGITSKGSHILMFCNCLIYSMYCHWNRWWDDWYESQILDLICLRSPNNYFTGVPWSMTRPLPTSASPGSAVPTLISPTTSTASCTTGKERELKWLQNIMILP